MKRAFTVLPLILAAGCAGHFDPSAFQPAQPQVFRPMVVQQGQPAPTPAAANIGPIGYLVRERSGQSPTGSTIRICTYNYGGREFEKGFASFCPPSVSAN